MSFFAERGCKIILFPSIPLFFTFLYSGSYAQSLSYFRFSVRSGYTLVQQTSSFFRPGLVFSSSSSIIFFLFFCFRLAFSLVEREVYREKVLKLICSLTWRPTDEDIVKIQKEKITKKIYIL